jgi:hypothetical protein
VSSSETERRFVEIMSAWLVSLPHDLKVLYEAASDENLERKDRELAVGTIISTISPNELARADRFDFLSYCDDCVLLRLALRRIVAADDEDAEFFRSRFADFFDPLDEELTVCQAAMGEFYSWLDGRVEGLRKLEYKGKKVTDYLDDDEAAELLYEDGLGFATEYPVDEETIGDKLKKASTILDVFERRKREYDRKTA